MSAKEWEDYALRNPPRVLKPAMQRGGSAPAPSYGLWEDRVFPFTRKNKAQRKAPQRRPTRR